MGPKSKPAAVRPSLLLVAALCGAVVRAESDDGPAARWVSQPLDVPYEGTDAEPPATATLELLRQDYEELEVGRSVIGTPLVIGRRKFTRGLGTHSIGHIRIRSPEPLARLSGWIGVDHNERTSGGRGSIVFVVSVGGRDRFRSGVFDAARTFRLHGLQPDAEYDLRSHTVDRRWRATVAALAAGLLVEIPRPSESAVIVYERIAR